MGQFIRLFGESLTLYEFTYYQYEYLLIDRNMRSMKAIMGHSLCSPLSGLSRQEELRSPIDQAPNVPRDLARGFCPGSNTYRGRDSKDPGTGSSVAITRMKFSGEHRVSKLRRSTCSSALLTFFYFYRLGDLDIQYTVDAMSKVKKDSMKIYFYSGFAYYNTSSTSHCELYTGSTGLRGSQMLGSAANAAIGLNAGHDG